MDLVENVGWLAFQVLEQLLFGVTIVVNLEPFICVNLTLYLRLVYFFIADVCVFSVFAFLLYDINISLDFGEIKLRNHNGCTLILLVVNHLLLLFSFFMERH